MIFLSASVPDPKRHKIYYDTADVIAIRDAVRALATIVIPKSKLVWGGHPAITPLIRYVMLTMDIDLQKHITLYQTEFFRDIYPPANSYFENVVYTSTKNDRDKSLYEMRLKMFKSHDFDAGIFIGGMDGVEAEFEMFRNIHPNAAVFPVASTGAAAKIIYDKMDTKPDTRLVDDFAYMALFRSLFEKIINI
ncbi:MAG: hypothetical protein WDM90_00420 [Ferruginibacter sp.]